MSWFGILHWNAAAGFQGWAQTRGQKRQALGCQGGLPAQCAMIGRQTAERGPRQAMWLGTPIIEPFSFRFFRRQRSGSRSTFVHVLRVSRIKIAKHPLV